MAEPGLLGALLVAPSPYSGEWGAGWGAGMANVHAKMEVRACHARSLAHTELRAHSYAEQHTSGKFSEVFCKTVLVHNIKMETRTAPTLGDALPHGKIRVCPATFTQSKTTKQPLYRVSRDRIRTFHGSRVRASAQGTATGPAQRLIRMATGVPLSEAFKSMSLSQAAFDSAIIIVSTVTIVLFGNKLIAYIGKKVDQVSIEEEAGMEIGKQKPLLGILATIASAAERPAGVLLPWFGVAYCSTVLSAFAEVVVERLSCTDHGFHEFAGVCACRMATFLRDTAQLMQDTTEIVMITFV